MYIYLFMFVSSFCSAFAYLFSCKVILIKLFSLRMLLMFLIVYRGMFYHD